MFELIYKFQETRTYMSIDLLSQKTKDLSFFTITRYYEFYFICEFVPMVTWAELIFGLLTIWQCIWRKFGGIILMLVVSL